MRDTRFILLILFILIIMVAILLIRFIFKYNKGDNYKVGYSYLPKNVTKLELNPIINEQSENIEKCITKCKNSTSCNGITFDSDNYKCMGYEEGLLAKTDPHLYAWEKPISKIKASSQIVIGENHSNQDMIKSSKMPLPYEVANFMFSFWITINDWYSTNHGYWKCVFFKGHTINIDNSLKNIIKTNSWEEVIQQLPAQCIGVWLAPYTNNMRICVSSDKVVSQSSIPSNNYLTDTDYTDIGDGSSSKFNQNFNVIRTRTSSTDSSNSIIMEYFDLLNITISKSNFIAINIHQTIMEIYQNDKLSYIVNLEGIPRFNGDDLNVKNTPSFDGYLQNISYLPYFASYKEIKDIYQNKPRGM
jgi:hypothetical protein